MVFLILDIETVPRRSIDEAVEEAIGKKVNPILNEPVMIRKMLNHSFVQPHPFSVWCYVLVCAGSRMMEALKTKLYVVKMKAQLYRHFLISLIIFKGSLKILMSQLIILCHCQVHVERESTIKTNRSLLERYVQVISPFMVPGT